LVSNRRGAEATKLDDEQQRILYQLQLQLPERLEPILILKCSENSAMCLHSLFELMEERSNGQLTLERAKLEEDFQEESKSRRFMTCTANDVSLKH